MGTKRIAAVLTAVAATVVLAAPAQALTRYSTWTYDVSWLGWPTLLVTEFAGVNSNLRLATSGGFTGYGTAVSGAVVGVDPHIQESDADWVSCTLRVNGITVDSDFAASGDGTDVICMGVAP